LVDIRLPFWIFIARFICRIVDWIDVVIQKEIRIKKAMFVFNNLKFFSSIFDRVVFLSKFGEKNCGFFNLGINLGGTDKNADLLYFLMGLVHFCLQTKLRILFFLFIFCFFRARWSTQPDNGSRFEHKSTKDRFLL